MMCDPLYLGFSLCLMFSRFIRAVALCGRMTFRGVHGSLFIRSSVDRCLDHFCLLVNNAPGDFGLHAAIFTSFGDIYLRVELLGHVVIPSLTFRPSCNFVSDGSAALLPRRPLSPYGPPGLPCALFWRTAAAWCCPHHVSGFMVLPSAVGWKPHRCHFANEQTEAQRGKALFSKT